MNPNEFRLDSDCSVQAADGTYHFASPAEAESFVSGEERLIELGYRFKAAMADKALELQTLARLDEIDARLAELDAYCDIRLLDGSEAADLADEIGSLTQEREALQTALIDLHQAGALL